MYKLLPNITMPEYFSSDSASDTESETECTSELNNLIDGIVNNLESEVNGASSPAFSPKRKKMCDPIPGPSSQPSGSGLCPKPGPSSNFNNKLTVNEPKAGSSSENLDVPDGKPFTPKIMNLVGRDKAMYTLEIFMRDSATCLRKNDKARKSDPRCPIIYDKNGRPNAIIPANHKILIYCQRTALSPNQRIRRGNYVLFKFFVDGEALSDGQLHEASVKEPDVHWAKAHIDTHPVRDDQTVEEANQANPFIGTFIVKVWTKLKETTVKQGFTAVPEDDRVHEKTKRRICCAVDNESTGGEGGQENRSRKIEEYKDGTPGLVEVGQPQGNLNLSYDDLVGTRARHLYEKAFQIDKLREAGVSEEMLKQAFPGGIPGVIANGTTITLDDDEDIKEEKFDDKDGKSEIKMMQNSVFNNVSMSTTSIKKESESDIDSD